MTTVTTQSQYDFLYDLYADCISNAEIVVIAQKGVSDPTERRVLCEQLGIMATDDAILMTDDDLRIIHKVAIARATDSASDEERAEWQRVAVHCIEELQSRADEYVCPECGGDMREGGLHNVRVGVDAYACYGDPYDYADYAFDDRFSR